MTGGEPSSLVGREVEVLRSDGSHWCRLPPLPAARFAHTQTGLVTCGSGEYHHQEAQTSCISFTGGTWTPSHHLVQPRCRAQPLQSTIPCIDRHRWHHTSWASPAGVVLLGGYASEDTTELLSPSTAASSDFFPLEHLTEYSRPLLLLATCCGVQARLLHLPGGGGGGDGGLARRHPQPRHPLQHHRLHGQPAQPGPGPLPARVRTLRGHPQPDCRHLVSFIPRTKPRLNVMS